MSNSESAQRFDTRVRIYSGPNCYKCEYTKKHFARKGIPFEVIEDPEQARVIAEERGLKMSLPVAEYNGFFWSDLDTGAIEKVVRLHAERHAA